MRPFSRILRCVVVLAFALSFPSASSGELLPPGFRPLPLGVHALVGGRVVVKPGEVVEPGTIVIRNGLIQVVGKDAEVPADARVWDMKGMTIYAGFIEPYLVLNATNPPISTVDVESGSRQNFTSIGTRFYGAPGAQTDMGNPGPGYQVARITPEFRAVEKYSPRDKGLAALREVGFTTGLVAPAKGIIRGTSALVALTDEDPNKVVIRPDVFQHIALETAGEERGYPNSLMGVIAVVRQSFFDAQHYAIEQADYEKRPQGRRPPEYNASLQALAPASGKKVRVAFEPGSVLMVDRAARLSRELGFDLCMVASGQEWRRPDLVKATGAAFIVPVNFPSLPKLPGEDDWTQVSLDQLRAWDWAPENPALLRQQGLEVALTTYGLSDKKSFRKNVRLALDRGLSEDDALAALTTVPAKLCGVENQLGTIEAGKLADLTVVEGTNYFNPDAKVRAVWIDGRIYPSPPEEPKPGKAEEPPKTVTAAATEPAPAVPPKEEPEKHPTLPPDGPQPKPETTATNVPPEVAHEAPSTNGPTAGMEPKPAETKEGKKNQLRDLQKTRVARSPMEGRGPITNPPAVLIRNAILWTCGPAGILTNAQLLVSHGKVLSVGDIKTELPADTIVVDAGGQHVTPGIIDCHSHSFVVGSVNEGTLPSTSMVRLRDVVNSETDNYYRQLAGGVTAANVLHGSANPIGGQNCVVKLRDGESPEGVIFAAAPEGIKFALGENVKQSNWGAGNTTRFPQTRMGVRTFLQNRFIAAQAYLQEWADYSNKVAQAASQATNETTVAAAPVPPARDLELEAIGEIIQGKRLIHCHAYRQDEIVMLLRLMDSFGVKVASLQHVLEGYKVADEMAAHGAGGSTFSDWWAYKFEVYDAIPHNGSLMRERGAVVSFNSDSSELARRLYLEAAKAVKYGGTSEAEALKFVTLNPAKQLRIDPRVGSLEPGKDGDFAIWSKSPLDSGTMCVQTWIEGKKYFDRSLNEARTGRLKQEREDLIAKAKKLSRPGGGGDGGEDQDNSFWRVSLEHEFDGRDRHCLDGVANDGSEL